MGRSDVLSERVAQDLGVLADGLVIGIFTIATNLMADGLAEASQKGD